VLEAGAVASKWRKSRLDAQLSSLVQSKWTFVV